VDAMTQEQNKSTDEKSKMIEKSTRRKGGQGVIEVTTEKYMPRFKYN